MPNNSISVVVAVLPPDRGSSMSDSNLGFSTGMAYSYQTGLPFTFVHTLHAWTKTLFLLSGYMQTAGYSNK